MEASSSHLPSTPMLPHYYEHSELRGDASENLGNDMISRDALNVASHDTSSTTPKIEISEHDEIIPPLDARLIGSTSTVEYDSAYNQSQTIRSRLWRLIAARARVPLFWLVAFVAIIAAHALWTSSTLSEGEVLTNSRSEIDHALPIFAIVGKTGVGKSSFIDILGGRDSYGQRAGVCHGLDSCKLRPSIWHWSCRLKVCQARKT